MEALSDLNNDNPEIFMQGIYALSKIGNFSIKYIIQDMKNKRFPLPHYSAICRFGDAAVEQLIKATKNSDATLRANAIACLGTCGPEETIFSTIIPALNDNSIDVRHQAAVALIQYDNIGIIRPIIAQESPILDSNILLDDRVIRICLIVQNMNTKGVNEVERISKFDDNLEIRNSAKIILKNIN